MASSDAYGRPVKEGPTRGTVGAVRILFAFAGGSGHLEPLVPLGRAAHAAGPGVQTYSYQTSPGRHSQLIGAVVSSGGDVGDGRTRM